MGGSNSQDHNIRNLLIVIFNKIATFSNCGNFLIILILNSNNSIFKDKLAAKSFRGCSSTTKCKWVHSMNLRYSLVLLRNQKGLLNNLSKGITWRIQTEALKTIYLYGFSNLNTISKPILYNTIIYTKIIVSTNYHFLIYSSPNFIALFFLYSSLNK